MSEATGPFCVNAKEVAAKVIDGEAIIINLSTGVYYSLDGTGGEVWSLLEAHHDVYAIAARISSRYGVDADRCRTDIRRLVDELVSEDLLVPFDGPPAESPSADGDGPPGEYAPPRLNVYRDMGDLLALDPPVPGLEPIPWDDPLEQHGDEAVI